MTWVLVLSSDIAGRHPAVIGGYYVRAEAEAAGELATAYEQNKENPWQERSPHFNHYVVIPGIAEAHQYGSTHCSIVRDPDSPYGLIRKHVRFGARWPNGEDAGPIETATEAG